MWEMTNQTMKTRIAEAEAQSSSSPLTAFKMHDRLVNGTCTDSNFHGILLCVCFFWCRIHSSYPENSINSNNISGMQPTKQPKVYLVHRIEYYMQQYTYAGRMCMATCTARGHFIFKNHILYIAWISMDSHS